MCTYTLGIEKSATPDEIKKGYRKNGLKHHPDKTPGFEEKMKKINLAKEVLLASKAREYYDHIVATRTIGFII